MAFAYSVGVSAVLVILSGLPGVGKTSVARELAGRMGAVHLRIDSVEAALRRTGVRVEGEGYEVAYAIAFDNLRLGRDVVADCVNPWRLTRQAWRDVAARADVRALDVELVCTNLDEHRRRVEGRTADISGQVLPAWSEVIARDYESWATERLVIDTAAIDPRQAVEQIAQQIARLSDS